MTEPPGGNRLSPGHGVVSHSLSERGGAPNPSQISPGPQILSVNQASEVNVLSSLGPLDPSLPSHLAFDQKFSKSPSEHTGSLAGWPSGSLASRRRAREEIMVSGFRQGWTQHCRE